MLLLWVGTELLLGAIGSTGRWLLPVHLWLLLAISISRVGGGIGCSYDDFSRLLLVHLVHLVELLSDHHLFALAALHLLLARDAEANCKPEEREHNPAKHYPPVAATISSAVVVPVLTIVGQIACATHFLNN